MKTVIDFLKWYYNTNSHNLLITHPNTYVPLGILVFGLCVVITITTIIFLVDLVVQYPVLILVIGYFLYQSSKKFFLGIFEEFKNRKKTK